MIGLDNPPVFLNSAALVCSLGQDIEEVADRLFASPPAKGENPFISWTDRYSPGRIMPLGLVGTALVPVVSEENTRNNRLLATASRQLRTSIEELKGRFGPHRIGLVIGTSTSGIAEGEEALVLKGSEYRLKDKYRYEDQEFSAPARFLAKELGVTGPGWVVSTACTSGGKALASAARLLRMGICDAVIAGGVDTLCRMTMAGFSALRVTSDQLCLPFSANRQGINIGEGAGLFIVTREPGPVRLAGAGECSDAHHISSPHPEGRGAEKAIFLAMEAAGISAREIGYLNLHGTATQQNDAMEAKVVNRVFGDGIACSSTKSLTGHTLAAAGAIEAVFCWLALQREDRLLPPHFWDGAIDQQMPPLAGLGCTVADRPLQYAMSNSFAFGGNNLSLIFSRE